MPVLKEKNNDTVNKLITIFNDIYYPLSNSLKSFGALYLTIYLCKQQLRLNKSHSRLILQAVGAEGQQTKDGGGMSIHKRKEKKRGLTTEIKVTEDEFDLKGEDNQMNRARTKIPLAARFTKNVPSSINEEQEDEIEQRENLEAIMEIDKHDNKSEYQDDTVSLANMDEPMIFR